jgi:hypothetical protein
MSTEVEGVTTPIRHTSFQLRVPELRTRPGKQVIRTYWSPSRFQSIPPSRKPGLILTLPRHSMSGPGQQFGHLHRLPADSKESLGWHVACDMT